MSEPTVRPKRVILKISGEGFCNAKARGIQMDAVVHIAEQTAAAAKSGTQMAIVLGGGNILRGAQFTSGATHIHESTAHYMGMIATVMNGLALQDALESLGQETRVMTAIKIATKDSKYTLAAEIAKESAPPAEPGWSFDSKNGTASYYTTSSVIPAYYELSADGS